MLRTGLTQSAFGNGKRNGAAVKTSVRQVKPRWHDLAGRIADFETAVREHERERLQGNPSDRDAAARRMDASRRLLIESSA